MAAASLMATHLALAERYTAPGLGTVALNVPASWQVKERPGPVSAYLEFQMATGEAPFVLQLTSTWLDPDKAAEVRRTIKERAERSAKRLLANATETEFELKELNGSGGTGYYYALTGREAASTDKEYKYLTQGMLATNVGMTVFTVLQRNASAEQRQQMLDIVASASYAKDTAGSTLTAKDAVLGVIPQEASYQLWLPSSRLYMDIPKANMTLVSKASADAPQGPRYFHFVDRGLNVSGWFEPAQKYDGVKAFWASETAAWAKNGLPEAQDVVFKQINKWDAIVYDSPVPSGTNAHIRAHWVQAGTWIDLHISFTSNRSSAELREALETYLKAVFVRERP